MKRIFRTYEIPLTRNLATKIAGWLCTPMFFWLTGWNLLETTRSVGLACGVLVTLTLGIVGHLAANDLFPEGKGKGE